MGARNAPATNLNSESMNVALVGYGYWGKILLKNLLEIKDFNLKAVVDLDYEQLKPIKAEHPEIDISANYQEVFKRDDIEAVLVGTEETTHYQIARHALHMGKHVFIEKPMTCSFSTSKELVLLAEKNDRTLMVNHLLLYSQPVVKIKELLADKRGDILYIDCMRVSFAPQIRKRINVLWDLAPHDISVVNYLLEDMPVCVSASGVPNVSTENQDTVDCSLYYRRGKIINLKFSWKYPLRKRQTLIRTHDEVMVYDECSEDSSIHVFSVNSDSQAPAKHPVERVPPLAVALKDFLYSIEIGHQPLASGKSALDVIKIIDALQSSLDNNGEKVFLDLDPYRLKSTNSTYDYILER